MTRKFNAKTTCPKCGGVITLETPFDRWLRNHAELDSSPKGAALAIFDCDIIVHKYLTHTDKCGTRNIQALMFVEVKTNGAELSYSQQDTLSMIGQLLRNRKTTPTKDKIRRQVNGTPNEVFSRARKCYVRVMGFGGHLLQMEGDDPESSKWMKWDNIHDITTDQLVQLFRFELDPDTLKPTKNQQWRRHHSKPASLFDKKE